MGVSAGEAARTTPKFFTHHKNSFELIFKSCLTGIMAKDESPSFPGSPLCIQSYWTKGKKSKQLHFRHRNLSETAAHGGKLITPPLNEWRGLVEMFGRGSHHMLEKR